VRATTEGLRTDVPVTLLYGDSERFKQRVVAKLAEGWLGDADDEFARVTVDADEAGVEGVLAELASGSLLAPRRLVIVRDVATLSARKLKDRPNEQEQLAEALEGLAPGVAVVLVARRVRSERKQYGPPVGKRLQKTVTERGQMLELSTPKGNALAPFLQREMQKLGKSISGAAAETLIRRVGEDADRLLSELEKLASYLGEREEATEEDVRTVTVVVTEEDVFKLVDAVGARDAAEAMRRLDGLLPVGSSRGAALPVLGMIARQLRLIWQARYVQKAGYQVAQLKQAPAEVTEKLPEHHNLGDATKGRQSWLAPSYAKQSRNFSDAQLARALDRVYQADLSLKGQSGDLDDRTVMELLIADLCG